MKTYELFKKLPELTVGECVVGSSQVVMAYDICSDTDDSGEYYYLFLADGTCCEGDNNIIIPNEEVVINDGYLVFNYNGLNIRICFIETRQINLDDYIREISLPDYVG